jgi:hypothetical protein
MDAYLKTKSKAQLEALHRVAKTRLRPWFTDAKTMIKLREAKDK